MTAIAMNPAGLPADGAAPGRGPSAFVTTHWSLVVRAAEAGTADGRAALGELCRIYWYPLYSFARRRGVAPHDAEDLTQGFFGDLLSRGAVARADATRGRFRTFLLASFQNFQSHQQAYAGRLKRGGGQEIVSLEALQQAESRFQMEPVTTDSPEKLYDRKWATSLLDETLATVRREYVALGKAALFEELKVILWGGRGEVSYAAIAGRLGSTEGAVKVSVHRLRKRFREELQSEVAKTVLEPADIEAEIRYLFAALSG
jgi:RNA polymerase sigma factor (sigma-70 family)